MSQASDKEAKNAVKTFTKLSLWENSYTFWEKFSMGWKEKLWWWPETPTSLTLDLSHFTNVYEILKTFTLYTGYITLYKNCKVIKTLSVLNSENYWKMYHFTNTVQFSRWVEKPVAKTQFNCHTIPLLLLFVIIFIITTVAGSRTWCRIIVWSSPQSATPSLSPAGSSWSRWWTNCA